MWRWCIPASGWKGRGRGIQACGEVCFVGGEAVKKHVDGGDKLRSWLSFVHRPSSSCSIRNLELRWRRGSGGSKCQNANRKPSSFRPHLHGCSCWAPRPCSSTSRVSNGIFWRSTGMLSRSSRVSSPSLFLSTSPWPPSWTQGWVKLKNKGWHVLVHLMRNLVNHKHNSYILTRHFVEKNINEVISIFQPLCGEPF